MSGYRKNLGTLASEHSRLTHNYWIHVALGRGANEARANMERDAAVDYITWVFGQVCQGKRVSLHGLGTIFMTYRKERSGVGTYGAFQKARYVLKIKVSRDVKAALVQLAEKYPDPRDLPANICRTSLRRLGHSHHKRPPKTNGPATKTKEETQGDPQS